MKLDPTFTQLPLRSSFNYKTIVDNYFSKTLNPFQSQVLQALKLFLSDIKFIHQIAVFYINFKTKLAEYVLTLYVKSLSIICQYISVLLFVTNSKL